MATAFLAIDANPARADGIIVGGGEGAAEILGYETYVAFAGDQQVLVESIRISARAKRIAWIRAFPTAPTVEAVARDFFDILRDESTARGPHRDMVEGDLFGPSLVTLISNRLRSKGADITEPDTSDWPHWNFAGDDLETFSGTTQTSTITGANSISKELDAWLAKHALEPTRHERTALLRYCTAGWTLVARLYELGPSTESQRAVIGPTKYALTSEHPVHPVLLAVSRPNASVPYDYFIATATPHVPAEYDTIWNQRPWERNSAAPVDAFIASYNGVITDLLFDQLEGLGLVDDATQLVRGRIFIKTAPKRDMQFVPARSPTAIPDPGARGGAWDIIVCLLLGLAPLLYTPESWFFLWLGARAREKARMHKETALGSLLWPAFCFAVAAYWLATLTSIGRVAAILPALAGIYAISKSQPAPDGRRIRASFATKQRGAVKKLG